MKQRGGPGNAATQTESWREKTENKRNKEMLGGFFCCRRKQLNLVQHVSSKLKVVCGCVGVCVREKEKENII